MNVDPVEPMSVPLGRDLLFDRLPVPAWVYDKATLRFLTVNQAAVAHYGYSADEFRAMTIADIRPTEDVPRLVEFNQTSPSGFHDAGIWRHLKRDGSLIDVHVFACDFPLDGHGAELVVSLDVTERLRAERAVRQSEERLRNLGNNLPHGAVYRVRADAAGGCQFTYISAGVTDIFGVTPAEVLADAKSIYGRVDPRDIERLRATERAALHLGFFECAFRARHRDGRVRHLLCRSRPHFQADGSSLWDGVMLDETDRVVADEEARRMERMADALFEHLPLALQIFAPDGLSVRMNESLRQLLGISTLQTGVGQFNMLTDPFAVESGEADRFRRTLAGELVFEAGIEIEMGHASNRWPTSRQTLRLDRWFFAVPDGSGGVQAVVSCSQDVTARFEQERERERFAEQARETQRLEGLGVLAGGVAHDFNNLLTVIVGGAGLARSALSESSPIQTILIPVEQAAQQAADLCRQLLAYAGRGQFQIEVVDLATLVSDSATLLRLAAGRRAELHLRTDSATFVRADPSQLRQVLLNLVTNAAEAIAEPGGSVEVHVGRQSVDRVWLAECRTGSELPAGEYVLLTVRDNGPGMSDEVLMRIFDPFYTTKFSGRGLGLSAVLGIARGHGGALRVDSVVGAGTTFSVLLPMSEARPEKPMLAANPTPICEGGMILVIDDEDSVRAVAVRMLEWLGYRAIDAGSAADGVARLRQSGEEIRLVLLDLMMPEQDGLSALQEIRRTHPTLPVVMMSGYTAEEMGERFEGLGVGGFLQKPFRAAELRERVATAMG